MVDSSTLALVATCGGRRAREADNLPPAQRHPYPEAGLEDRQRPGRWVPCVPCARTAGARDCWRQTPSNGLAPRTRPQERHRQMDLTDNDANSAERSSANHRRGRGTPLPRLGNDRTRPRGAGRGCEVMKWLLACYFFKYFFTYAMPSPALCIAFTAKLPPCSTKKCVIPDMAASGQIFV